ncbi:MAG TPA: carboxypeptidase-like regulatory domain-containing protein [Bryobacteraceae bacterium]|nr:carboxypeptidase-like regulatory domain-containing protein [Bryobacteraceae bacterium]
MRTIIVLCTAGLLAGSLYGQEYRGTFSGSVTDEQGAAIPKAAIVATETRTGTRTTAITESTGEYTLPFLAPGEYEISAEAPGFKRTVRQGLTLNAGEHPIVDFHLQLGAVSDSITVTAESPLVTASTASIGQSVSTHEVEDIPINGRAPIMLMTMAMGVIGGGLSGPIRPFDLPGAGFTVGGISGNNEFQLDGAPNTETSTGVASAYSPPQDAVQEVSINGFESDASMGHAGGGTANLITKRGTNSLHGSAYEFNQSSLLDANTFYNNKGGVARPPYHYNQYGVTAGGPVWVPKVFNGKNRVFWFFGYEGLRDSDPANSPIEGGNLFATVPTAAERQGDFSALLNLNSAKANYAIYNPYSGVLSGAQVMRTPFPNNVVPTSLLNPIAMNYLQYYPQPNTTGQPNGFENFNITAVDSDGYDNELGRLDFNISDKNKLAFDARHSNRTQDKNFYFGNGSQGDYLYRINQGLTLDDVYIISPTIVMDVRGNWTRFVQEHRSPTDKINPTSLGFPSYIDADSQFQTMPFITMSSCSAAAGASASYQCMGYNSDDLNAYDSYQIFGDVVITHGNHTLKAGVDVRDYKQNTFVNGNSAGNYTFDSSTVNSTPSTTTIGQTWTNGPLNNATPSPIGQDFAAFLMGLPSVGTFDLNSHSSWVEHYYSVFVQDDWRARSDLVINLGLRWEHETPTFERYDRVVDGFNPTVASPISAAAAAAYASSPIPQIPASQFTALGGLTFASPAKAAVYTSNSSIFSPRVGFAWTPKFLGGKTVLRSGFGVFVNPLGIAGLNQEGFSQTTQMLVSNNNYLSPANTLSNPFPSAILPPSGTSLGAGTFLGQALTFYNPHSLDGYSMRWDFAVQRQLPGQFVLEVAYIGNHALHLPGSVQLDYIPRQFLSTSPVRDNTTISLLSGSVTNPFKGLLPNGGTLNNPTVPLDQLLVPYPQFPLGAGTSGGIVEQGVNAFSSYYHSLNIRLQKRFTQGLTLINNFVWSSLVSRTSYLNDSDPAPEKLPTDPQPLREILALSYDLPVGRGKPLNIGSKLGNAVFGGWALNTVLTLASGTELAWGDVLYYGGPLNLQAHQPNGLAFNTAVFNTVSSQQLANNIRTFPAEFNDLRSDPNKNLDLSILKNFRFGERMNFQLRFETFNVTNRVTFGAPNLTPTSSAFGEITTQANTPRKIQVGGRLVW